MKKYFEKALPVWETGKACEKNYTLLFRAVIEKENNVLLRLTGSCIYQIFINGKFMATGPARAAHGYYRVDELYLDPYLQEGKNVVVIQTAGYYVNSFYLLEQPAFLCAEILSGGTCLAATGVDGFRARAMKERIQKVQRYSYQRPFVEVYEWSKELEEFKTQTEVDFVPVELVLQDAKTYMERGAYYPKYEAEPVKELLACGQVLRHEKPLREYKDRSYVDISDSLHGFRPEELEFGSSEEITRQEYISGALNGSVKEVLLQDGEYVTYSFGGNRSGAVEFEVVCYEDTTLYMTFGEVEEANEYGFRLNETVDVVVWKLKAGTYHLITFEPYVMQYVRFASLGGACLIQNVRIRRYGYPEVKCTLQTNRERLQKVYDAAIETFRQNLFDIPMDCPSRERAGWLCDSFFMGRSEYALTGKNVVERNFLENYALFSSDVLPKGMVPMCYPADFEKDPEYIPQWAMWYVLELADYYTRTGDKQLMESAKLRVDDLLSYFESFENEDGLLERLDGVNLIEQSDTRNYMMDINFPTNMLYARMLECVSGLYGDERYQKKAGILKETIYAKSYRNGFFMDQAVRKADGSLELTGNISECGQYLAFFTGVADFERCKELWDTLVQDFGYERRKNGKWPNVLFADAFVGDFLRMDLLCRYGEQEKLLQDIEDYFYPMAEKTGTLWEHETGHNSCNHGFASYIVYLMDQSGLLTKEG